MLLNIKARMSINLSAQTLEQVLSRRRKMLLDMADGERASEQPVSNTWSVAHDGLFESRF